MLKRTMITQWLIDKKGFQTYLEIGVCFGESFFPLKANKKIAVDPDYRFGFIEKLKQGIKHRNYFSTSYYKIESDRFFEEAAVKEFSKTPLDICLVDGMHQYAFALRDVENALEHLSDNGVIIMHDCNPASREAGATFEEWEARQHTGDWNGDVWKAILHLRSTRNDINTFVLDCDHGLGIITKGKQEKRLAFTPAQIEALTYEEMDAHRKEWLNLKPETYLYDYFRS